MAREPAPLDLTSDPGQFWPDVFVNRRLPWRGFLESGTGHIVALAAVWGITAVWPVRPQLTPVRTFDRSQVIYFSPSEYLPPLDTGDAKPADAQHGDPVYAKQPILSVPPEADNTHQTIVSPPEIRLAQDIATPNVVSWGDHSVPVPMAATSRTSPALNSLTTPVVAPPPEIRHDEDRTVASLQSEVVAPAPDVSNSVSRSIQGLTPAVVPPPANADATRSTRGLQAPQGGVVPPPPVVQLAAQRVGEFNVAPSQVIAPAPELTLPAQRSIAGVPGNAKPVIPPPPTLGAASGVAGPGGPRATRSGGVSASGNVIPPPPSTAGAGTPGGTEHLIALGIHPEAVAPPAAPGNRRGTFAASPEGKAGAVGTPEVAASHRANTGNGGGSDSSRGRSGAAPPGLHVGAAPESPSSTIAGSAGGPSDVVNPNLLARASAAPSLPHSRQESSSDMAVSPLERKVFGQRHVYSMTLNMPNLNSAGGSWVIRFAESKENGPKADLTAPVAVHKVDPAYPLELMRQNVAGTVTLQAVIAADGSVDKVQVLQGVDSRLDTYACEALRHWHFFPATRNGNPVDLDAVVVIPFRPVLSKY
jgi:TonB family protein